MKANELRIGNLVKHDSFIGFIVSIYKDGVIVDFTKNPFKIDGYASIQPIPLTEEWLVKLGFERDKTGDLSIMINSIDTHLFFVVTKDWFYPSLISEPEYSNTTPSCIGLNRIQYVHQLQNLYFALTGEELTIKQ